MWPILNGQSFLLLTTARIRVARTVSLGAGPYGVTINGTGAYMPLSTGAASIIDIRIEHGGKTVSIGSARENRCHRYGCIHRELGQRIGIGDRQPNQHCRTNNNGRLKSAGHCNRTRCNSRPCNAVTDTHLPLVFQQYAISGYRLYIARIRFGRISQYEFQRRRKHQYHYHAERHCECKFYAGSRRYCRIVARGQHHWPCSKRNVQHYTLLSGII